MKKVSFIISIVIIIIFAMGILLIINKDAKEKSDNYKGITFELMYESQTNKKLNNILAKDELSDVNYNIYSYNGIVKVRINNEILNLRDALLAKKITAKDILNKCINDVKENKINLDMYQDGGTTVYKYSTYWITKFNTLDGNIDVYISEPNVSIDDLVKR